jgi:hypothetical protein
MSEAVLFAKCLGFTDSTAIGKQIVNPNPRSEDAGATEIIGVSNLTIVDNGVENVPDYVTIHTHASPLTGLSAKTRVLFQNGTDTYEWDGSNEHNIGIVLDGPMVHTPIDCRISDGSAVYKSTEVGESVTEATVGSNPNPPTSREYAGMPAYNEAFMGNGRLFAINAEDPRFIQYSEPFKLDLWNLGDNFIGHSTEALNANAIATEGTMCLVSAHSNGVHVYVGGDIRNCKHTFYPCSYIEGTLFSGFINKAIGQMHVFLCNDGVYTVSPAGELVNITPSKFTKLHNLNASYNCCVVDEGKYLAFGNSVCVEYDFTSKAVMLRASTAVGAALHNAVAIYAVDDTISMLGTASETVTSSITLPFSDFGKSGVKSLSDLYFSGIVDGALTITATDIIGDSWEIEESGLGTVQNYRIVTPKGRLGNHISLRLTSTGGLFRMEELRAIFTASSRTR